ncbi:MAG: hypothetical protein J5I98_26365 [Phaeodactylibacter sp.]|nr:hypothetical protein [Phaeodactylibacter sp.]
MPVGKAWQTHAFYHHPITQHPGFMQHLYTLLFFLSPVGFLLAGPTYHMTEPSSTVPLFIRNKLILVEGQANGQSGYFLFDTGASELALNEAYFPRQEHAAPGTRFADVSGHSIRHGYAFVDSFYWAGLCREAFFGACLDMSALESRLGEKLLGIIGYDVLQHVDLEIDYYRKTMILIRPGTIPPRPSGPHYTFHFRMNRHLPVLKAGLGDATDLDMAIDSGSSVNVCSSRFKKKLKNKALQKRRVSLLGASGASEQAPYYIMESMVVENAYSIAYCRIALASMGVVDDYSLGVDGLLGVNFFRLGRVFFSYQSRRIDVWLEHNDYTMRHSTLPLLEGMSAE